MRKRFKKGCKEIDMMIVADYKNGLSMEKVADIYSRSIGGIQKILKMYNIKSRSNSPINGENNPKRIFSNAQELRICEEYKNGLTLKDLASKYGRNEVLFSKILRRNNFQARIDKVSGRVGKYCSRYVGGRYKNHKGYVCLYMPEYKWCHKGGWIQEHRYVMQEHLKRKLSSNEHIHHINGIKGDNRIENLCLMSSSEHRKLHNKNH